MVHPSIPLSSITRYVLLQTVHRLTHLTPFKAVSILLKHDLKCYGFYRFIIVFSGGSLCTTEFSIWVGLWGWVGQVGQVG
jgi:hypothetical protein